MSFWMLVHLSLNVFDELNLSIHVRKYMKYILQLLPSFQTQFCQHDFLDRRLLIELGERTNVIAFWQWDVWQSVTNIISFVGVETLHNTSKTTDKHIYTSLDPNHCITNRKSFMECFFVVMNLNKPTFNYVNLFERKSHNFNNSMPHFAIWIYFFWNLGLMTCEWLYLWSETLDSVNVSPK